MKVHNIESTDFEDDSGEYSGTQTSTSTRSCLSLFRVRQHTPIHANQAVPK